MQYKTLINPSFLVLMLDVQEHIQAGWEIDPNNLPANTFVYYEVNLIKDDNVPNSATIAAIQELERGEGTRVDTVYGLFKELESDIIVPPTKKAGRPAQNKAAQ